MREDKVYAECFSESSKGHAVFKNESALDIRPGTVGYFDYDGSWKVVIRTLVEPEPEQASHFNLTILPKPEPGVVQPPAKAAEPSEPGPAAASDQAAPAIPKEASDKREGSNPAEDSEQTDTVQPTEDQAETSEEGPDQAEDSEQTGGAQPTEGQAGGPDLDDVMAEAKAMDLQGSLDINEASRMMEVVDRAQQSTSQARRRRGAPHVQCTPLEEVDFDSKPDQEAWGVMESGNIRLSDYEATVKAK